MSTLRKACRLTVMLGMLLPGMPRTASSQEAAPKLEYIHSVPLAYPRLVRQTDASAALHLYGDVTSPEYRDVERVDGIDDRRHAVLQALAERFSPYLVMNTPVSLPMDWKKFMDHEPTFPLVVDTWDLSKPGGARIDVEEIDYRQLGTSDCDGLPARASTASVRTTGTTPRPGLSADCRMIELLREFYPDDPTTAYNRTLASHPDQSLFKVMYLDFPGHDEESWKEAFQDPITGQLRRQYWDFPKVYAHPFLNEVRTTQDGLLGYELIMQYWLFYPFNDGGNNHEGDWEHISVVISPMEHVTEPLPAQVIQDILGGAYAEATGGRQLVIKRVEYNFHHWVMMMDYGRPNVYQPREAWEEERDTYMLERLGEEELWNIIRRRAYWDDAETIVNTHPIGYIGADNKGFDQVLAFPGGKNRDSHGTYPYRGMFRNIGPAGATEEIRADFDHRDYYARYLATGNNPPTRFAFNEPVIFDGPERVEVVPDWERIVDLVQRDAQARRDWSWLVLPIYWGYPVAESPFSDVVENVDMGNVAPPGPAHNHGWNRSGPTRGYSFYDPHRYPGIFPLGLQDNFNNNIGFLNVTYPVLGSLPPFDFLWRIVSYPIRAVVKKPKPTYYPSEEIPFRFFDVGAGVSTMSISDDFQDLLAVGPAGTEFVERLIQHIQDNANVGTLVLGSDIDMERAVVPVYKVVFHMGRRFTTENQLRHSRTDVVSTATFSDIPDFSQTGKLNLWEYAGSLRYNLATGRIEPHLKAGYGWSWYRIEDLATNEVPFENEATEWIRKPGFFENLLPNTFHVGGGLDVVPIINLGGLQGLDVTLRGAFQLYIHDLGLDESGLNLEQLVDLGFTAENLPRDRTITRPEFTFTISVGY